MRKAFTLIELLISITILSIMMLFLYKSYASLNLSNKFYKNELSQIKDEQLIKKVVFLDFSLALSHSTTILNQDKKEDAVLMQSSNSLHKMYNPYIAYIVNNSKLYRLESFKKLTYPLNAGSDFSVDFLGEVNSFRIYKSNEDNTTATHNSSVPELYLVHIDFKKSDEEILLKIKTLEN